MVSTISLSQEMKEKLKNLGRTGDSYEDVISKMYDFVRTRMLDMYLNDESDSVLVSEALVEAKKKWQKS